MDKPRPPVIVWYGCDRAGALNPSAITGPPSRPVTSRRRGASSPRKVLALRIRTKRGQPKAERQAIARAEENADRRTVVRSYRLYRRWFEERGAPSWNGWSGSSEKRSRLSDTEANGPRAASSAGGINKKELRIQACDCI